MKHGALVEAALLDQQTRILAATPADIHGRGPGRRGPGRRQTGETLTNPTAIGPQGAASVYCGGDCGLKQFLSQVGPGYICQPCRRRMRNQLLETRKAHAAALKTAREREGQPLCNWCGRRQRLNVPKTRWYCTSKTCATRCP